MYDELIKRLRKLSGTDNLSEFDEAADAIEEMQGKYFLMKKTAEWLAEKVPRWIPVSERLPDVFKHVLVNIPGMSPLPTVQEAFREKNGMWYSSGFRYGADEITHWMPLPEPPKEGV